MPTCYVTTPFGKRTNLETGQTVDYDHVYQRAIKPAAEKAGCSVKRADDIFGGALIHKAILELAIAADVFIADLGGGNANVMYEVGVRHASKRGPAILVAQASNRVPFNVSYSRVLTYDVGFDGEITDESAGRLLISLSMAIEQSLSQRRNDSPVFEYFPGYKVELPEELRPVEVKSSSRSFHKESLGLVAGFAEPANGALTLEALKACRDRSDWDQLIRLADERPLDVEQSTEIQQIVALALNRRNGPGERDRAISLMEKLIAATGGDGETYGILGRIYKDRFASTKDQADIDKAIASYRSGFEKEPSDYYPGVNLVNLLLVYGGESGRAELAQVLPKVRHALNARMDPQRSEYWELATALHLAAIAGEWEEANHFVAIITDSPPEPWMLKTTLHEMERLEQALSGVNLQQLKEIVARLKGILPVEAPPNA